MHTTAPEKSATTNCTAFVDFRSDLRTCGQANEHFARMYGHLGEDWPNKWWRRAQHTVSLVVQSCRFLAFSFRTACCRSFSLSLARYQLQSSQLNFLSLLLVNFPSLFPSAVAGQPRLTHDRVTIILISLGTRTIRLQRKTINNPRSARPTSLHESAKMSSAGFLAIDTTINTAVAVAPTDQLADTIIGVAWLGTLYSIGMIWTTLSLIDRWRGPHGTGNINFIAVVAALILSIPWPAVLLITTIM